MRPQQDGHEQHDHHHHHAAELQLDHDDAELELQLDRAEQQLVHHDVAELQQLVDQPEQQLELEHAAERLQLVAVELLERYVDTAVVLGQVVFDDLHDDSEMSVSRPRKGTFARGAALALVALAAAACGRGPATSSEYNNSGHSVAVALNSHLPDTVDNGSVPWSALARDAQQREQQQAQAQPQPAEEQQPAQQRSAPAAPSANGPVQPRAAASGFQDGKG